MAEYPGFITRQSLVDFCQDRLEELQKLETSIEDALNVEGITEDDKADLFCGLGSRFGEQKALRDICEWAKEHQAPSLGARAYSTKGG